MSELLERVPISNAFQLLKESVDEFFAQELLAVHLRHLRLPHLLLRLDEPSNLDTNEKEGRHAFP